MHKFSWIKSSTTNLYHIQIENLDIDDKTWKQKEQRDHNEFILFIVISLLSIICYFGSIIYFKWTAIWKTDKQSKFYFRKLFVIQRIWFSNSFRSNYQTHEKKWFIQL